MSRAARLAADVLLAAAILAILLLTLLACGPRFDPQHPDVILIVVDTLRADRLGCYGYSRPNSPHLDALAAHGTVFDAAMAAAPWTLPSVMSIMTSQYPSIHRVENDGLRLAKEMPTLAERMRQGGYATGGFVSHIYVSASFGFDRGFSKFDDFGLSGPGYKLEAGMEPTADKVTAAALDWLRGQREPVFLFVHYFDPHWPYNPPPQYRRGLVALEQKGFDAGYDAISRYMDPLVPIPDDYKSFLLGRYDGEIRFVDDQIGRLLAGVREAGRGDRTWVVVTGDHGEEFKEHGSMGHGRQLYEEVVRVPLLVAGPALPGLRNEAAPGRSGDASDVAAGRGSDLPRARVRVQAPVSGIDLAPTILELAGLPLPKSGLHGVSLRGLLRGDDAATEGTSRAAPERALLSETVRLNAFRKAVRSGDLKLIHFMDENRSELYDLASDSSEKTDLSESRAEDRKRLMKALSIEGDLLSGAWNLRWAGDGRKHRFSGRITTTGAFRSVVPLFTERGKYDLKQGKTLEFIDDGQTGESGLSFTTSPYDAPVTFTLLVDDRQAPEQIRLGGHAAHPGTVPFTLEGSPDNDAAFSRPTGGPPSGGGFALWRTRPAAPDQPVTLDDETRERLRSLGYVN